MKNMDSILSYLKPKDKWYLHQYPIYSFIVGMW